MAKKRKIEFGVTENIAKNLVFIDGLPRCGKSLFSGILSSLDRFEHIKFFSLIEHIVPSAAVGAIDIGCAKAILRLNLNELIYNSFISRNVNFRPDDQTGIWNYKDPKVYFQRLSAPEGDSVVEEIRKGNHFVPFQTHDLLSNLSTLDKLEVDYRMLTLFRDPLDVCYSWWKRGWGDRFGADPRAFTLLLKQGKDTLPWYSLEEPKRWLRANPQEKCVLNVLDIYNNSLKEYKAAAQPERLCPVFFEDFVQKPHQELDRICGFLNTSQTDFTERAIKLANCPRVLIQADKERKLLELKGAVEPSLWEQLMRLTEQYEAGHCGIKKF
ncbi:MAG: sulfotransferase [Candidatus Omnitrophica bacterium]|nr:sulfotransferase [Candidatus Omnitrophota bacterium]